MQTEKDLREEFVRRTQLNFERLSGDTYAGVFREPTYDWPGDWEGRYLLAGVMLRRLTGKAPAPMQRLLQHLDEHTNEQGYFGAVTDGKFADEQQLSGNGWFLRGLCEYYADSPSDEIRERIGKIVRELYLKSADLYARYPIFGARAHGGVSGSAVGETDGWKLSSDVGCAFIALDGLSAAYVLFPSEELKQFIDGCMRFFLEMDLLRLHLQTHATLTCCRAVLRMYEKTGNQQYLTWAKKIFSLYTAHGMTLTYENFNWFGREDSWTEPCAVIDSLIVSLGLYKATGEEEYLVLARRIWLNAFRLCQRDNGGAGTNSCVTRENGVWRSQMYEAYFCCSMRTAEGLYWAEQSLDLLLGHAQEDVASEPAQDEYGRWFCGDRLLCSQGGGPLIPLPSAVDYSETDLQSLRLRILFAPGEKPGQKS